ncbi:MAG: ABC transporter permease [Candidatus Baltobacteraceae bacterium]
MTLLRAFVERDVRLALSYPSTLITPFASVALTVAGFAFLARIVNPHAALDAGGRHIDYFSYVVVNLAFMLVLNVALQCVPAALRRDQVAGTLEPMLGSPAPVLAIVFASAAWPICFALLQGAAYIGVAMIFGLRIAQVDAPLLALFLALGGACAASMGALGAAAVIAFKQGAPSTFFVGSAATLLTGVLFPVALLPEPLQYVSWLLPLTHTLRGARTAMAGGGVSPVQGDALWLAAATLILLPAGIYALHAAITHAKRDGSLSAY